MAAMPKEAQINDTPSGKVPAGAGWFVLNAREAQWLTGDFGAFTRFEGDARFEHLGINIGVLEPGQPACYYHGEDQQEDFLVLSGECLLIIEEQERHLVAWDFVHCPPWTKHVFVGAGDAPCAILAVGARPGDQIVYPDSTVARRHGAGVSRETRDPSQAYAGVADDSETPYQEGWLPDYPAEREGASHTPA